MTTLLDEVLAYTDLLVRTREHETAASLAPVITPASAPTAPPAPPRASLQARRRPLRTWSLILVLAAVPTVAPAVRVRVGGQPLLLHMQSPTIATLLVRAGEQATDGPLLSAVSRQTIDAHYDKARVFQNGRLSSLGATATSGAHITISNGAPSIEPIIARTAEVPGRELPGIEYQLWHLPQPGVTEQRVGLRSGEIVDERTIRPPVAATPVTTPDIALSFDDGPNPQSTPAVLAILHAAGVKATFCIVGYAAARYPELVRAIRDEGHTLCNHTMHHVQLLGRKSAAEITSEIEDNSALIERISGVRPRLFRAPGGTWSPNLVEAVHRAGLRALGWNIDPADFSRPGTSVIASRVLSHAHAGAVVLMHDGGGNRSQTVAALNNIIGRLRALGYTFRVPA